MSAVRETSNRRKASGEDCKSAAGVPDSKRLKNPSASNTIDRINTLPEALIVHILSLLPTMKDKIRTGALAWKWQYLWTHVPKLYFSAEDAGFSDSDDFVKCVNKTLVLCAGSNVKCFGVEMDYCGDYASQVDTWTRFASRNEIEKFELDFSAPTDIEFYTLPHHLYKNSAFRELGFSWCDFGIARPVSWNSLKKLSISDCEISNESLEKIIEGTPALQTLHLLLARGIYNLNFGNSSLKKLIVHIEDDWDPYDRHEEAELKISAPTVQSLDISGWFWICKLVDMTSLVESSLLGLHQCRSPAYPILTQEFVNSLLNVHTLTLGTWVIQGTARLRSEGVHPPLSKCKCLTVDTHIWKTNPSAIASLLKSSPGIETLIVTMNEENKYQCFDDSLYELEEASTDQYWTSQEEASSYFMHLRTVKIDGFGVYREAAFSFVKFLLKKAKVLRKMTIYLEMKDSSRRELFETSQKLLSFPRSSTCAELLVYE